MKKRVDGPTVLRTTNGKIAKCAFCNKVILLRPNDVNIAIEMEPQIIFENGQKKIIRRYRHALCLEKVRKKRRRKTCMS